MPRKWKKAIAIVGSTALAAGGFFTLKDRAHQFLVPAYYAERVVDGDTFVTTENQMIRVYGIDAPALDLCGGEEAKAELTRLIMGKKLYLKVVYRDSSNRLISRVFTPNGDLSVHMLKAGWSVYLTGAKSTKQLTSALSEAKLHKRGVFSPACTQSENIENPKCVIKGNLRGGLSAKIYHFPGCGQYTNSFVQLSLGDRWFCTEKQALDAGFTKGSDCFDRVWSPPR